MITVPTALITGGWPLGFGPRPPARQKYGARKPQQQRQRHIRRGLRAIFHILGRGLVRSRKVEVSVPDGNGRMAITPPASLPAGRTKAHLH